MSQIGDTYNILLLKPVNIGYEARNKWVGMMSQGTLLYERKDWIDRKECAAYLTALGLPIAVGTLCNMASHNNAGRGPPFYRTRWNRVRYKPSEVADWAKLQTERVP